MELVKKDTTSKIINVFLRDSVTGQGKTGVPHSAMSGGYTDGNSATVGLSFSAGAIGDAYSPGKWAEQSNGNYKYHSPNGKFDQYGPVRAWFSAPGAIDAKVDFQVVAFDPSDPAWLQLLAGANEIYAGAVEASTTSSTTTAFSTTLTVDETWEGRTLIFTSGQNKRLPVKITAASLVSSELRFTVETHSGGAMPNAPADADTFIIV
jgi:hypothetical protein